MSVQGVKKNKYKVSSNTGYKGISMIKKANLPCVIECYEAHVAYYTKGGAYDGGKLRNIYIGRFYTLEEAVNAREEFIDNL